MGRDLISTVLSAPLGARGFAGRKALQKGRRHCSVRRHCSDPLRLWFCCWQRPSRWQRTFTGTAGPDTINGTQADDTIDGLAGDDRINGLGGSDQINGSSDNDTINGDGDCPAGTTSGDSPYYCIPGVRAQM